VRDSLADHLAEILGLGVGQVNEGRQVGVASKRQLTINRVSNNVGGVKHFLGARQHARGRVRHFALVENAPIQPRLARNQVSGQELSPTHASLRSQPRS
jgi:hypothetical protein